MTISKQMLKEIFITTASRYSGDSAIAAQLWAEIEKAYTAPQRHYHNLHHLQQVWQQLAAVKHEVKDWELLLFSLCYHDLVYDATRADNEEQSARLAADRLRSLSMPEDQVAQSAAHIMATKGHHPSIDPDTNLFTDADLFILGADWNTYLEYTKQIRQEYHHYSDEAYRQGRKNVLQHFLRMPRIFKTAPFYEKYEKQARENLQKELQWLG